MCNNSIQQSLSQGRMVDSSLEAIEKLIDGVQLVFHSPIRHLDQPLTELYDLHYQQQQQQQQQQAEITYESINQICKRNVDQFVSSVKEHSSYTIQDHTRQTRFLPIFDERSPESVISIQKCVIGILIVLVHDQSQAEWMKLKRKLMESAIPLLQEACYTDQRLANNDLERKFFTSLIWRSFLPQHA